VTNFVLEEFQILRLFCRYFPLVGLLPFCVSLVNAQSAIDVGVGFGGAWASANQSGLDNADSTNAFGGCTPGGRDTNCVSLPKLSSFMLGFSGDVMIKPKFGAGFEYQISPAKGDYGPLQFRQAFYDFNAIYRPIQTKRAALNLEGGIGGARTSFSITQTSCVGTAVCSTQSGPVGTASHFQEHVGVGVQLFVTEHLFIRPQFDVHFVNGFTDQFGRNVVPSATVWVGYNLGSK
jgi:hypothetical protein